MDLFDKWQSFLTFALAVVPWLIPNLELKYQILSLLIVLLISCSLYCIRLKKQLNKAKEEYDEIKARHSALATRFNEKQNEIILYREAIKSTEYLISVAAQSSKQERLNILYNSFIKVKSTLISQNKEGD